MNIQSYVCPGKKNEIFQNETQYLNHIWHCFHMKTFKELYQCKFNHNHYFRNLHNKWWHELTCEYWHQLVKEDFNFLVPNPYYQIDKDKTLLKAQPQPQDQVFQKYQKEYRQHYEHVDKLTKGYKKDFYLEYPQSIQCIFFPLNDLQINLKYNKNSWFSLEQISLFEIEEDLKENFRSLIKNWETISELYFESLKDNENFLKYIQLDRLDLIFKSSLLEDKIYILYFNSEEQSFKLYYLQGSIEKDTQGTKSNQQDISQEILLKKKLETNKNHILKQENQIKLLRTQFEDLYESDQKLQEIKLRNKNAKLEIKKIKESLENDMVFKDLCLEIKHIHLQDLEQKIVYKEEKNYDLNEQIQKLKVIYKDQKDQQKNINQQIEDLLIQKFSFQKKTENFKPKIRNEDLKIIFKQNPSKQRVIQKQFKTECPLCLVNECSIYSNCQCSQFCTQCYNYLPKELIRNCIRCKQEIEFFFNALF